MSRNDGAEYFSILDIYMRHFLWVCAKKVNQWCPLYKKSFEASHRRLFFPTYSDLNFHSSNNWTNNNIIKKDCLTAKIIADVFQIDVIGLNSAGIYFEHWFYRRQIASNGLEKCVSNTFVLILFCSILNFKYQERKTCTLLIMK